MGQTRKGEACRRPAGAHSLPTCRRVAMHIGIIEGARFPGAVPVLYLERFGRWVRAEFKLFGWFA